MNNNKYHILLYLIDKHTDLPHDLSKIITEYTCELELADRMKVFHTDFHQALRQIHLRNSQKDAIRPSHPFYRLMWRKDRFWEEVWVEAQNYLDPVDFKLHPIMNQVFCRDWSEFRRILVAVYMTKKGDVYLKKYLTPIGFQDVTRSYFIDECELLSAKFIFNYQKRFELSAPEIVQILNFQAKN